MLNMIQVLIASFEMSINDVKLAWKEERSQFRLNFRIGRLTRNRKTEKMKLHVVIALHLMMWMFISLQEISWSKT